MNLSPEQQTIVNHKDGAACSQKQGNERIKKRRREKRKNPPHDGLIKML